MTIFKYQEPEFFVRLFDKSEEGTFEAFPGRINVGVIRKTVTGCIRFYGLHERKRAYVLC